MKEKLEDLTVAQFVDLVCGNAKVLLGKLEAASPAKLALAMRDIVFEYKEIADGAGARGYLADVEGLVKARMSLAAMTMCRNLVILKEHGRAREVLIECGAKAGAMTDERVEAEVASRLERAKADIAKIESECNAQAADSSSVRKAFDEQTAALMAHFRFQIDTSKMKANIYAHLIARHNKEIKAQMAQAKKIRPS